MSLNILNIIESLHFILFFYTFFLVVSENWFQKQPQYVNAVSGLTQILTRTFVVFTLYNFLPTCTIFFQEFCRFAVLNWPVMLLNTAPAVSPVVLQHLTTSESLQKTGCGQKALFVAGYISHVEHKRAFTNITY